jgi:hypothetical protein
MRPFGVRRLFRFPSRKRDDVRDEVREEFAFHIDMRIADLVNAGMSKHDADAQALREFGDVASSTRVTSNRDVAVERRRWLGRAASELKQDAAYGLRLIARGPGFSTVAILTLALAIGANTAIFSLVNALFFKPSQLASPGQLARIRAGESTMSWLNIEEIRRRNAVFSDVVAQRLVQLVFETDARVVRLNGSAVTPDYFTTLGVAALAGRPLLPSDARRDVVVLSERVWRTEFGQDPRVIGGRMSLDGRSYEVIGVMPPKFRGLTPPGLGRDFWVPIDTSVKAPWTRDRSTTPFEVYGRLKPGVTFTQAAASMKVLGSQLKAEFPRENDRFDLMEVFPADGLGAFRGVARTLAPVLAFIALLAIVSGFVLLIGCANIAGLLLGRATARRREIAVRLAVGAGRARLIRQFLTESLLLAAAGGFAGVWLAVWLTALLQRSLTRLPIPTELDFTLDLRVLTYAVALSCIAVVRRCACSPRRTHGSDLGVERRRRHRTAAFPADTRRGAGGDLQPVARMGQSVRSQSWERRQAGSRVQTRRGRDRGDRAERINFSGPRCDRAVVRRHAGADLDDAWRRVGRYGAQRSVGAHGPVGVFDSRLRRLRSGIQIPRDGKYDHARVFQNHRCSAGRRSRRHMAGSVRFAGGGDCQ